MICFMTAMVPRIRLIYWEYFLFVKASSVKSLASTTQTFQPMASQVSKVLSPLQLGEQYEILPPPPPKKLTCPQRRDQFKRKFHLPTIDFQGIGAFSREYKQLKLSKKNWGFSCTRKPFFLEISLFTGTSTVFFPRFLEVIHSFRWRHVDLIFPWHRTW